MKKTRNKKRDYSVLLSTIVFMLGGPVTATANENKTTTTEPNTVMDVGGSQQDREITSKIRQELVANKNLSTKATNIQILTKNGKVILKGTVASQAEKTEVERIAKVVAGQTAVTNEVAISR